MRSLGVVHLCFTVVHGLPGPDYGQEVCMGELAIFPIFSSQMEPVESRPVAFALV